MDLLNETGFDPVMVGLSMNHGGRIRERLPIAVITMPKIREKGLQPPLKAKRLRNLRG